jgi:hypothetical protein
MKWLHRGVLFLALLALLVSSPGCATETAPHTAAEVDAVSGGKWFFCAMAQTVKVVGLVTANPTFVLVGAIGGGIACGLTL